MEKIKNIFDPGHRKDDTVLYGDGQSGNATDPSSRGQATGATEQPSHRATEGDRDGMKWDPIHNRYEPRESESTGKHGLLGSGDKTAQSDDRIDSPMAATHPHTETTKHHPSSGLQTRPVLAADNDTDASIKSGVRGYPPRSKDITDPVTSGAPHTRDTATSVPYSSSQPGNTDSHTGKSSALGAAAGMLGLGKDKHHHHEHDVSADSHRSGREFPLSGRTTNPVTERDSTPTHTGSGHHHSNTGRDPLAAVTDVVFDHTHQGHGHQYVGDPCPNTEPAPPHIFSGPHVTDTANRLDPHVGSGPGLPGDSSFSKGTEGSTRAATTTLDPTIDRSEGHSHHGRNVAFAGAAGVIGSSALSSDRDRSTTTSGVPATVGDSTLPRDDHRSPYSASAVDPRVDNGAKVDPRTTYDAQRSDPARDRDHQRVGDGVTAGTAGVVGIVAGSEFSKREAEKAEKQRTDPHGGHEDDTGTKRGGLMGLLHRDKDKEPTRTEPSTIHDHHHHGTTPATGASTIGTDPHASGFRQNEPVVDRTIHDSDRTEHGKDKKHGGLLGFLHSDKDKGPERTEPSVTHDRHQATPAVAAGAVGTTATARDPMREHDPVTEQRVHDKDVTDHEKEKKHGGLLGFLHSDKDKTHGEHAPEHDRHHKTEAVAGAGVVGAGAVAYDEAREREIAKERDMRAKELAHERAAHEKELAKERAAHEKQVAKEHKAHEKEHDKHHKAQEKEPEKDKKGGLLGFLHRDKDKDAHEPEPVHDRHHKHDPAVTATAATTTAATASDPEHGKHTTHDKEKHERNRLHKDPPPGYFEEMAAKHGQDHPATNESVTGPQSGVGLSNPEAHDSQRAQSHTVTDPRTGLPMDIGKYGDGHGGTDGDPTIEGYHLPEEKHRHPQ